jgi:hypothetical protein
MRQCACHAPLINSVSTRRSAPLCMNWIGFVYMVHYTIPPINSIGGSCSIDRKHGDGIALTVATSDLAHIP